MANNKSAEKRIRQSEGRRLQNRQVKSTVKTSIRHFQENVKKNDKTAAEESFRLAVKLMDTAARKKILHVKAVARKKSRLHKLLNALSA